MCRTDVRLHNARAQGQKTCNEGAQGAFTRPPQLKMHATPKLFQQLLAAAEDETKNPPFCKCKYVGLQIGDVVEPDPGKWPAGCLLHKQRVLVEYPGVLRFEDDRPYRALAAGSY